LLLDDHDATALADLVRRGDIGPRELVEASLARIEERNPALNAVVEVRDRGAVLADADAATGPLAGIPFVVKDLGVDVAGMRSTNGSRLWADHVAEADSEIIARFKAAGLVIIGTTNSPELGRSPSTEPLLHGPTRNPHAPDRSAGGSSGGTAAAIAARMVPAGHGNDGGGSIRMPASACGLVGLKPSRGRTPSHPKPTMLAYPMGVQGALTTSLRDTALLLDVAAGPVPGDPFHAPPPARAYVEEVGRDPGRLRVAVCTTTPGGEPVDAEAAAATMATARQLESLGHEVVESAPPWPLEDFALAMRVVMNVPIVVDVDAHLARLGRTLRDDDLEPFTRMLYDMAKATSGTDVVAALQAVERAGRAVGPFFEQHDLLLTPTMPVPPPPLGLLDVTDIPAMAANAGRIAAMCGLWNVTGQPAISLPLATWSDGVPMGLQLVARWGREDQLLQVGAQLLP
jgi:amidase